MEAGHVDKFNDCFFYRLYIYSINNNPQLQPRNIMLIILSQMNNFAVRYRNCADLTLLGCYIYKLHI